MSVVGCRVRKFCGIFPLPPMAEKCKHNGTGRTSSGVQAIALYAALQKLKNTPPREQVEFFTNPSWIQVSGKVKTKLPLHFYVFLLQFVV